MTFPKGYTNFLFKNFFIWLIPGSIILVLSFIFILIMVSASATGFEGGGLKRVPKGLLAFLGISYSLLAIGMLVLIIVFHPMLVNDIIFCVASALVLFILSIVALKKTLENFSRTY